MPNHTDCRLHLIGSTDELQKLQIDLTLWSSLSLDPLVTSDPSTVTQFWDQLKKEQGHSIPSSSPFPFKEELPFSFELASPMPPSLHVNDGTLEEIAYDALYGNGQSLFRYKGWADEYRAAHLPETPESIREWLVQNQPEAVNGAQMMRFNEEHYGHRTWYNWSIENWGTKWDAYDSRWQKFSPQKNEAVVHFNTAWSPPLPAIRDLCVKYHLHAVMGFSDEGGGFESFSVFDPDGAVSDEEDYSRSSKRIWPVMRATAKEIRNKLGFIPPEKPKGKGNWVKPFYKGTLFNSSRDLEDLTRDTRYGSLTLELAICLALNDLSPVPPECVESWLRALAQNCPERLMRPLTPSAPDTLAQVILQSGWLAGCGICASTLEPETLYPTASLCLFSALRANCPQQAQFFYEFLPPERRPNFHDKEQVLNLFYSAPETMQALSVSSVMPIEELSFLAQTLSRDMADGTQKHYRENVLNACLDGIRTQSERIELNANLSSSGPHKRTL